MNDGIERQTLPARAVAGLFRLWQVSFSVVLPPSCRFHPSCSHYGIEAIQRHGLIAGLWLTVGRIGRCHPWGGCGHDPVPDHFSFFRSIRPQAGGKSQMTGDSK